MIGAFLTGLYAFRLYFIVFTGEPTAFAREHFHAHHGQEGPLSMRWTVGVLAVLSTVAGFIQFSPFWTPFSTWLDPVAAAIVEPTNTQEYITMVVSVACGLAGIFVAWTIYAAKRVQAPQPVKLFERKFYWDELYDVIWYRGSDAAARGLYAFVEQPLIAGSLERRRRRRRPRLARALVRPDGARPLVRTGARRRPRDPRRRLPGGPLMNDWLTTILILLPFAGALLVAVAPLTSYWLGSLAALISLIEVGFWITSAAKFDFNSPSLQFAQDRPWFHEFGISYHIGQYAYSVWFVGMTVVVMAACTIYGWWVGRDRGRAYFALMLFLTGAIVGVFTAQDLLLFYAFFEAMLIPLYILIGVWGGPNRMRATITFVVYTVVGSLLMLAAIIVLGLQQGTFDLTTMGTSSSTWLFLGFVVAFAIKSPLFPFHGWLPDHLPRVAARGGRRALRRRRQGRPVRAAADRDPEVPDGRARLAVRAPRARVDLAGLRLAARVPRSRFPGCRDVLVALAGGTDRARALRLQRPRLRRRRPADRQPRADLRLALPARRAWSSAGPRPASSRGSAAWHVAGPRSRPSS